MSIKKGLQIPFGIQPVNPVPVDTWSGPYAGVTEALSSIPIEIRFPTMEVRILDLINGNRKYWFRDGVNDQDLIIFNPDSDVIDAEISARISGDTILYDLITGETFNRELSDINIKSEITGLTVDKFDVTGGTIGGDVYVNGTINGNG